MGQFAVQFAAASPGARDGTGQSAGTTERCPQLGAYRAVVSLDEDAVGPVDLVLDAVGGPQLIQVIHRLAPGATVVLYGSRGGGTDDFRLRDFYQAAAFNARVIAFIRRF